MSEGRIKPAIVYGAVIFLAAGSLIVGALVCERTQTDSLHVDTSEIGAGGSSTATPAGLPTEIQQTGVLNEESQAIPQSVVIEVIPTPDPSRLPPQVRTETVNYIVQYGDSLNVLAREFGVSSTSIQDFNNLSNPDHVAIGQALVIPAQDPLPAGPTMKLIPDVEFVLGPSSAGFDVHAYLSEGNSYLLNYRDKIQDRIWTGSEIVNQVALEYSINPRLLLAVLEHQSGWISQDSVQGIVRTYPMGYVAEGYEGLYNQLSWAADQLNSAYYRWRAGWNGFLVFEDGSLAYVANGLNAGTVAVHYLFAQLCSYNEWGMALQPDGYYQTYRSLFGSPFHLGTDPTYTDELRQPEMQLPFEPGRVWYFTGGPHSGWGNGAAWAALDFAPPGEALGCVPSVDWITAVADGWVVRVGEGVVVLDLDDDQDEHTGWTVLYMHVSSWERVELGTFLQAGERIGHPSCEGGISSGTHVHLARKYNGEWIPADSTIPFNLDGWISSGAGKPYDGWLTRGTLSVEAYFRDAAFNQISR